MPDKPFKKLLENIKKSGRSYKGAKRREHVISVDVNDLKDIYQEQDGKCFYSQEKFELEEIFVPNSLKAISADRIDNNKSYSKDNIVLCKRFYNNGRNQATVNEVMDVIGNNKGILYKARCYLIGPIEAAADCGVGWREKIKQITKDIGIIYFDPTKDKPFLKNLSETPELQEQLKKWRKNKNYAKLSLKMKEIRAHDLSLCDKSDFIIFNYDPAIQTCGSWEEIFLSNRQKKVCFFVCEKGLSQIPLWMFGVLPYKYFYESLEDVAKMLANINNGEVEIDSDRWRLLKRDFR